MNSELARRRCGVSAIPAPYIKWTYLLTYYSHLLTYLTSSVFVLLLPSSPAAAVSVHISSGAFILGGNDARCVIEILGGRAEKMFEILYIVM